MDLLASTAEGLAMEVVASFSGVSFADVDPSVVAGPGAAAYFFDGRVDQGEDLPDGVMVELAGHRSGIFCLWVAKGEDGKCFGPYDSLSELVDAVEWHYSGELDWLG